MTEETNSRLHKIITRQKELLQFQSAGREAAEQAAREKLARERDALPNWEKARHLLDAAVTILNGELAAVNLAIAMSPTDHDTSKSLTRFYVKIDGGSPSVIRTINVTLEGQVEILGGAKSFLTPAKDADVQFWTGALVDILDSAVQGASGSVVRDVR